MKIRIAIIATMLITGCTDASADLSTEPTSGSLEVATTMTTDMTSGTT
ncbi:MAG: hypothetical protein FJW19_06945, partial [Actinobacteria bacterium]|nr:hypothetical protein [Actinomycetota bacterium]